MTTDQDSALMSTLNNYFFRRFGIKVKTLAPYNHQSLLAEHGFKSLATMVMKNLIGLGQYWPNTYNLLCTVIIPL